MECAVGSLPLQILRVVVELKVYLGNGAPQLVNPGWESAAVAATIVEHIPLADLTPTVRIRLWKKQQRLFGNDEADNKKEGVVRGLCVARLFGPNLQR